VCFFLAALGTNGKIFDRAAARNKPDVRLYPSTFIGYFDE
jgi:hypothetical protein